MPSEIDLARLWLETLGPSHDVSVVPGNHDAYVPGAYRRFRELWAPWMRSDTDAVSPFPFIRRKGHVALIGISSAVASAPFLATGRVGEEQTRRLSALLADARSEGLFRVVLIHHPPKLIDPRDQWRKLTDGRRPGALGTIATFSFYPSKNLGAFGDGGAITTNDPALAETVRTLRFHGSRDKQHFELVGYNSRLDELQAGILRVQLPHLDTWSDGRRAAAQAYADAGLGQFVSLPVPAPGTEPIASLGAATTRSANPSPSKSPQASAPPNSSWGSAVSGIPGVSWWKIWISCVLRPALEPE